ncbi:unnamed protein product [Penicillium salamii]|uniref:Uncharacterized protein n=1 Tax=Penicillium salamii TaxID=1612424 RepID=A0A9W4NKG4_9EURO|nr:unnamed protein product [Penicillium salamii]CAG7986885.1 unnamed protein product [Penicillium salamii]CAG8168407.1 unnamed protein product [Penicillium salamii]CAG8232588.1 unnamed protein product [Penicillium salamii]CAG8245631.1 unnamed protein product [Penicillium salamii]
MPFPATPPIRLSNSSAHRNRPQFASTPRFLLSQSATQTNEDHDIIDDVEPHLTHHNTQIFPASQAARSRQREVIDDVDHVEEIRDGLFGVRERTNAPDDVIDSTPPEEDECPGFPDAELDALFTPIRDANKRRRVERDAPSTRLTQTDTISSSPPQTADLQSDAIHTPYVPRHSPATWQMGTMRTPAPSSARPLAPPASTPGDANTPFRGRPRFMLSSAVKHPSSQSAPKFKPSTPAISPPERRKPTFVLPRSPSPNPDAGDIPAPFSPTSRTLNRRGRKRGVMPNYVPGGMAAQLRSWVLEMGAKREQLPKPVLAQSSDPQAEMPSSEELARYLVAAHVTNINHTRTSGSNSVAFVKANPVVSHQVQDNDAKHSLNILIMGPPRSKPDLGPDSPGLLPQKGDLVGIHRGLTWTLELGPVPSQIQNTNDTPIHMSPDALPADQGQNDQKESWLVAMEWDLIHVPASS